MIDYDAEIWRLSRERRQQLAQAREADAAGFEHEAFALRAEADDTARVIIELQRALTRAAS